MSFLKNIELCKKEAELILQGHTEDNMKQCGINVNGRVKQQNTGVGEMESVRLPLQQIISIPKASTMGLHVQNHTLLYNILASCQLCVHLVYKGIWTSRCAAHGLRHAWIAPPLNKGMSGIPTGSMNFFPSAGIPSHSDPPSYS